MPSKPGCCSCSQLKPPRRSCLKRSFLEASHILVRTFQFLDVGNMREIVHIQGGQCGNQIGAKFWEVISDEHGESILQKSHQGGGNLCFTFLVRRQPLARILADSKGWWLLLCSCMMRTLPMTSRAWLLPACVCLCRQPYVPCGSSTESLDRLQSSQYDGHYMISMLTRTVLVIIP